MNYNLALTHFVFHSYAFTIFISQNRLPRWWHAMGVAVQRIKLAVRGRLVIYDSRICFYDAECCMSTGTEFHKATV
jgi:hypothetical protein